MSAGQTPLAARIAAQIAREGPIGVDLFMAMALYDPVEGYYAVRRPLGAAGDFTTAPEISQIFGELLGLWAAQTWIDLGRPQSFTLAEFGPGRGVLMQDALRAASRAPGFAAAASLHLVETNPHLRAEQAERLPGWSPTWHDDLPAFVSADTPGPAVILANEFLDCLPVVQAVRQTPTSAWREVLVGLDAERELAFGVGPAVWPPADASVPANARLAEWAPGLPALVQSLATRLRRDGGRALFIDYGEPHRPDGHTLQAVLKHARVPPLQHVGHADLTAHVDFGRLDRLANNQGLKAHGPVSQRDFLVALGVVQRLETLCAANPAKTPALSAAVARLIGKEHMGALFQAACVSTAGLPEPAGFASPAAE
jgi:NADH dehydrogenase [ubiquinone] 1 alpha subcomplex assembly factor 7